MSHSFNYLPGLLSGSGGKISYNFADSNFEFEDQQGGDGITIDVDQATGATSESELIGIQAIYKLRSQYFQQFTRDTQGRVRFTDDNETLDARVRYKLLSNLDPSLEAKNLLDEPRTDFRGVDGNISQALSYGPRFFLGLRFKFQ